MARPQDRMWQQLMTRYIRPAAKEAGFTRITGNRFRLEGAGGDAAELSFSRTMGGFSVLRGITTTALVRLLCRRFEIDSPPEIPGHEWMIKLPTLAPPRDVWVGTHSRWGSSSPDASTPRRGPESFSYWELSEEVTVEDLGAALRSRLGPALRELSDLLDRQRLLARIDALTEYELNAEWWLLSTREWMRVLLNVDIAPEAQVLALMAEASASFEIPDDEAWVREELERRRSHESTGHSTEAIGEDRYQPPYPTGRPPCA